MASLETNNSNNSELPATVINNTVQETVLPPQRDNTMDKRGSLSPEERAVRQPLQPKYDQDGKGNASKKAKKPPSFFRRKTAKDKKDLEDLKQEVKMVSETASLMFQ